MSDYQLFNNDCLEVMAGMAAQSVDAVICDPPYGIDYQSSWKIDKSQWKNKIKNDLVPFVGWGKDSFRVVNNYGSILIFYRWDVQNCFVSELSSTGWNVKSQIIWNKMSHGMGDLNGEFAPQHENILFARKDGFSFPGLRPKTLISYPKVSPDKLLHPNEKPVGLLVNLIKSITNEGDTVLDFTMGSGTTGVAAMLTGRKFIGIELDETYFAIAEKRIAKAAQMAAGEFVDKTGKVSDFDGLPMFGGGE